MGLARRLHFGVVLLSFWALGLCGAGMGEDRRLVRYIDAAMFPPTLTGVATYSHGNVTAHRQLLQAGETLLSLGAATLPGADKWHASHQPSKCVDGDFTEGGSATELDPYSCISRSGCETDAAEPYLGVDLGAVYAITTIKVHVGGGKSPDFSQGLNIFVGNDATGPAWPNVIVQKLPYGIAEHSDYTFVPADFYSDPGPARYVLFKAEGWVNGECGNRAIYLKEVEVYGTEVAQPPSPPPPRPQAPGYLGVHRVFDRLGAVL
eukprot:jgi/Tetstr1/445553/TSEL_033326.t1